MKNRTLKEQLIRKHLSEIGRIVVLTGARQTGKTTLLKNSFIDHAWILLDDPVLRIQYASMTAQQWKETYPFAILDEVQKLPQLIETVKAIYDTYKNTRYVLSGSSQLLLLEKVKESLAGRCQIMELFPLTLPEMLTIGWNEEPSPSFFQKLLSGEATTADLVPSVLMLPDHAIRLQTFQYYLKFGGYPAIIGENLSDQYRYDWLRGYVKTYLERDIRDLANFRNLEPFVLIQQMTALHTGQTINYSTLAKESGITSATAKRFLSYLEISYQIILLRPWFRNQHKRLVKSPKLHYLDIGVQHAILQKQGGMAGNEFESAVVAELYKQSRYQKAAAGFFHLRTLDGREVDLLIETEKGYYAIEVKMTVNARSHDASHLAGLAALLDKPLIASFVLSNDPMVKKLGENITAIPVPLFLT
jgi:predicted AAA+ superfamily ATPase